MRNNIMPRIGLSLEALRKREYINVPKTIYVTVDRFETLLESNLDEIVAVKMNDVFVNRFKMQLPSYEIFSHCSYYLFNLKHGSNNLGGGFGYYSDNLKKEDLLDKVYELIPTYEEMCLNRINEILTISEAAKIWKREVSTLRRNFATNKSFKLGTDCRKSGNTWLVTKESMERVYGKPIIE